MTNYEVKFSFIFPRLPVSALIDISISPAKHQRLALVYDSAPVVVWELKKSKVIYRIVTEEPVHCCTWSEDGFNVATGMRSGAVLLWRCKKKKKPRLYQTIGLDGGTAISYLHWVPHFMLIQGGQDFESQNQISIVREDRVEQIQMPHDKLPLSGFYCPLDEYNDRMLILSEDGDLL